MSHTDLINISNAAQDVSNTARELHAMTYEQAIRNLNEAAYAAIRACRDTVKYPDVDQQTLRQIARDTDRLVDEATKREAPALLAGE